MLNDHPEFKDIEKIYDNEVYLVSEILGYSVTREHPLVVERVCEAIIEGRGGAKISAGEHMRNKIIQDGDNIELPEVKENES